MRRLDNIFVQTAAYRDSELIHTLQSLLDEAAYPQLLRVCVCWQHAESEHIPLRLRRLTNIEIIDGDYRMSHGANWARGCVQRHWRNEPYSLIIDSHLRFVRHWDRKLIGMLEGIKSKGIERPAITCYPPNFTPQDFFHAVGLSFR